MSANDAGSSDQFSNFANPTAHELFEIILGNLCKYEVLSPLKGCRENRLYTVENCTLDDIICDDNGAYNHTNTSDGQFVVKSDENGVKFVRG